MDVAQKKAAILEFAKKQAPITLDFQIIKSREDFEFSYEMHDVAATFSLREYVKAGYIITKLGVDLRYLRQPTMIQDELPDFIADKDELLFCWDAKAKSSLNSFGWVNERAVIHYRQLAKVYDVPVYANFVQVTRGLEPTGRMGHCDITSELQKKIQAWNGNTVYVFNWQEGLVYL